MKTASGSVEPASPPGQALAAVDEQIRGWGMAVGGEAHVVRPQSEAAVRAALELARNRGWQVALRGAGCSYGDASCGTGKLVVDLTLMNKILDFDANAGVIRAEAGATLRDVWQLAVPQGWWPPVVSGTMAPTLGGALAMNIHGKNAYKVGTIGEHVTSLRLLTADGTVRTLTPIGAERALFHAVIGGLGMLGVVLEVELRLKRVYSGQLEIHALSTADLGEMFGVFETWEQRSDYLVGWIDAFASGAGLGRGQVHVAHQLAQGSDPQAQENLAVAAQELPPRLFGVIPKSWMWALLKPFAHGPGMRLVNFGKFWASRLLGHDKHYRQSHAGFHFLLDYVPNWKWVYRPGGLIQHQSFVPRERARDVFAAILRLTHDRGLPSWLAVMKRHRPDPFLLTHGLDGYSLALDFPVTNANRAKLWAMCHAIDDLVVAAGGRFYFAKDATVRPESVAAAWPSATLQAFADLRQQLDPQGLFATDLYARTVAPALALATRPPPPREA